MSLPLTSHSVLVITSFLGIVMIASIATIAVELGLKAIHEAKNA